MRKYNKNEYNREYNKKKYKQLKIYLSADEREQIQNHAAKHGEAVGTFLKRAAAAQIERDRAEDERRAAELGTTPAVPDSPEAVAPPTVTISEPETIRAEQSRPTLDGKQTAAKAPEHSTPRTDNDRAEISTTDSTTEAKQDGRTTTAPKPRRRRPTKQAENDPAQLTLDDSTTGSNSGRG